MTLKMRRSTPGRRRWSEAEARSVLAALERSGQSVFAFARSQGLGAQRIYWWRQRLRQTRTRTGVLDEVGLVPVRLRTEDKGGLEREERGVPAIVVRSVGGVVIEVPTSVAADWLAALSRELEGR